MTKICQLPCRYSTSSEYFSPYIGTFRHFSSFATGFGAVDSTTITKDLAYWFGTELVGAKSAIVTGAY